MTVIGKFMFGNLNKLAQKEKQTCTEGEEKPYAK